MAYPKMKPCPCCDSDERLAVYTYEHGWRHVECLRCDYRGPGEGNIRQAIKSHNDGRDQRREKHLAACQAKAAQALRVEARADNPASGLIEVKTSLHGTMLCTTRLSIAEAMKLRAELGLAIDHIKRVAQEAAGQ